MYMQMSLVSLGQLPSDNEVNKMSFRFTQTQNIFHNT
jgi:hypothetical protein